MKEGIKVRGLVTLELRGPDGRVKQREQAENIVTNAGRAHIIDRLQGAAAAICDYIAIGTDATAAAAADIALGAEVARGQDLTPAQPDAYTDRVTYTFPPGTGTGTIAEVGRLNAGAGGTLMGRTVLGASVVKGALDSLQITYDFTYAAG